MAAGLHRSDDYRELELSLAFELRRELIWRCACIASLLAGGVLVTAIGFDAMTRRFAIGWLCTAVAQIAALVLLHSRKKLGWGLAVTEVSVGLCMLHWWLLLLFPHSPALTAIAPAMLLNVLLVCFAPWQRISGAVIIVVGAMLLCMQGAASPRPELYLVLAGIVVIMGLRVTALEFAYIVQRSGLAVLSSERSDGADGWSLVKMYAWFAGLLLGSRHVVIVGDSGEVQVVDVRACRASDESPAVVKGVAEKCAEPRSDDGAVATGKWGEQAEIALRAWFGFVPGIVLFSRFSVVRDGFEERLFVLVPPVARARAVGRQRSLQFLSGLARTTRVILYAARRRIASSDLLAASHQALSSHEHEMTQVVHAVNNAAQTITASADDMRKDYRNASDGAVSSAAVHAWIVHLEETVRCLSADVSDVKLQRELLELRRPLYSESVLGTVLFESLADAVQRRVPSQALAVSAPQGLEDLHLQVVSVEYANTSIRALVRALTSLFLSVEQVSIECVVGEERCCFTLSCTGEVNEERASHSIERLEQLQEPFAVHELQLQAAHNFFRASDGDLHVELGSRRISCTGTLSIAAEVLGDNVHRRMSWSDEPWVLLVDDNPEMTVFYSRVCSALKLESETAADVTEALRHLEERGCPQLLLTDLQLGEQSGLEIVRLLREKYKCNCPVIVVSGATDADLSQRLRRAGVDRYLVKPVSRRTLFEEVKALSG